MMGLWSSPWARICALVVICLLVLPSVNSLLSRSAFRCGVQPSSTTQTALLASNAISSIRRSRAPPPPINEYIRADPVRVIAPKVGGSRGEEEMLGIYPLDEAISKAQEMELDLVMINEKGDPPVCKIIDYGKYKYIVDRKKRENQKKQVKGGLKEVKMSYKIDTHDFDVRVRAARRFISEGDRVKVLVQFKGREMQHKELGHQVLARFFEPISDTAVIESPAKLEGRSMFMQIAPKKIEKKKN